ncbi:MAG: hypothetical protein ACK5LC_08935 [Coprobacillaceae bacterium]
MNLYAIFEAKVFQVNYYVDELLYQSRNVRFGENAEQLVPPDKEGNRFLKWNVSLDNITHNIDVYAIYELDDITKEYPDSNITMLQGIKGDSSLEKNKNFSIIFDSTVKEKTIMEETNHTKIITPTPSNNIASILTIIFGIISIGIFVYIKRK